MTEQEAPKIEFPCRYPIKVVGRATPDYAEAIRAIFDRHTTGPGCVAVEDGAYRLRVVRCRAPHHFNGIATGEFNFRCFLFCHALTDQILEPQN